MLFKSHEIDQCVEFVALCRLQGRVASVIQRCGVGHCRVKPLFKECVAQVVVRMNIVSATALRVSACQVKCAVA
jgi:hypothetical protein